MQSPLAVVEEDEGGCVAVEAALQVDEGEQRAVGGDESGTTETSQPQPRRTTSTMSQLSKTR